MTSWIRVDPLRRPTGAENASAAAERPFLYQTSDAEFCSIFNSYLYSHMWAQKEGRELMVYDYTNPLAVNYPLLSSTFQAGPGVRFVSDLPARANLLNARRLATDVFPWVGQLPIAALRDAASKLFTLNPKMDAAIRASIDEAKMPLTIDLCLYLSAAGPGGKRELPTAVYLNAVRSYQARLKKKDLVIYVMSDSDLLTAEFRRQADPSWRLWMVPNRVSYPLGSVPGDISRLSRRQREQAYLQTLTELTIAQNLPAIIGNLNTPLGQFLFLTMADEKGFLPVEGRAAASAAIATAS